MEKSNLEFVLSELTRRKGEWKNISDKSGFGYSWLTKLHKIKNPGAKRIDQLASWLRKHKEGTAA